MHPYAQSAHLVAQSISQTALGISLPEALPDGPPITIGAQFYSNFGFYRIETSDEEYVFLVAFANMRCLKNAGINLAMDKQQLKMAMEQWQTTMPAETARGSVFEDWCTLHATLYLRSEELYVRPFEINTLRAIYQVCKKSTWPPALYPLCDELYPLALKVATMLELLVPQDNVLIIPPIKPQSE